MATTTPPTITGTVIVADADRAKAGLVEAYQSALRDLDVCGDVDAGAYYEGKLDALTEVMELVGLTVEDADQPTPSRMVAQGGGTGVLRQVHVTVYAEVDDRARIRRWALCEPGGEPADPDQPVWNPGTEEWEHTDGPEDAHVLACLASALDGAPTDVPHRNPNTGQDPPDPHSPAAPTAQQLHAGRTQLKPDSTGQDVRSATPAILGAATTTPAAGAAGQGRAR